MDLPWILLFISVILVAMIAWHSSKVSIFNFFKPFFVRKKPDPFLDDYHEEVQDDLFPEEPNDFMDEFAVNTESVETQAPKKNEIFCIHLKAAEGRHLGGEQLVIQLNRAGLRFGAYNIFHFENLFSLASAYEPGTFDLDRLDQLKTPALTFFMETSHIQDVRDAFETMLDTAQHLASQLRAELFDDQWQPLTEDVLSRYYEKM